MENLDVNFEKNETIGMRKQKIIETLRPVLPFELISAKLYLGQESIEYGLSDKELELAERLSIEYNMI